MIEKLLDKILSTVTDPTVLVCLLTIAILTILLFQREKGNRDVYALLRELSKGLAECNESICGMVPLLEVLVYGKGGKKNE